MTIKTYALLAANGNPLKLPLMNIRDAEKARDTLAKMGKTVYVVNVNAE